MILPEIPQEQGVGFRSAAWVTLLRTRVRPRHRSWGADKDSAFCSETTGKVSWVVGLGSEVQQLHYRGEYGKPKYEDREKGRSPALRDTTAEMGTVVVLEVTTMHCVLKLLLAI